MKPFFTDKIFFTATKEEMQMVRTAVSNLECLFLDLGNHEEYQKALKLREDMDTILRVLPF